MHGMVKQKSKYDMSPLSFWTACLAAVACLLVMRQMGFAQKWNSACTGTLSLFWYITGVFRKRWSLPSFWIALTTLLAAHLLLVVLILSTVLKGLDIVGRLLWIPVAVVEVVPLYIFIDVLERKLRGPQVNDSDHRRHINQ